MFTKRIRIVAPTEFDRSLAGKISLAERWTAAVIFLVVFFLRVMFAANYRIDSDETQHLHVVWAWTNGMIPYRDYFDNHSPLFHFLFAPLFALFGVRPDIVVPMRLAMIPLAGSCVFFVGKIASTVFSPRVGLWAAIFTAVCPRFFFVSAEFRPDDLWVLVWLVTIFVAVGGRLTLCRSFIVGLLLGTSFCVSMKTVLMAVSMGLATFLVLILQVLAERRVLWILLLRTLALMLVGALVLPALLVLYFASCGALTQMYYCLITHNIPPVPPPPNIYLLHALRWLGLLIVPLAVAVFIYRRNGNDPDKKRVVWIFLVTFLYYISLKSFWPILTSEDYLPSDPLFMALLAHATFNLPGAWLNHFGKLALGTALALTGLCWIVASESPFRNRTADKIGMVANVLRLTSSSDYVMDAKGETIYRRRPFYYVLEGLTGMRIKAGLIKDVIPERLIATRTPVATIQRMPSGAAAFIRANYIPIAFRLSVLGKMLQQVGEFFPFDIVIPSEYAIVTEFGKFAGTLNGESFAGPRHLVPGHYEVRRASGSGRLAVILSTAVEKGYSPFVKLKADKWTAQD
jgi:Dolichyl-phosphate-mannose-protein mannosyltransferase